MRYLKAAALCLAATAAGAEDEHHDHLAEANGVRIVHAWTNATDGESAEVYMEVENEGDAPVAQSGGETEAAELVELVASPIRGGDGALPETLDAVTVDPGATLALEPGGLYLMLSGLTGPLDEGKSFPLEVHLDPAGHLEVIVQVEATDATEHSHAGHSH